MKGSERERNWKERKGIEQKRIDIEQKRIDMKGTEMKGNDRTWREMKGGKEWKGMITASSKETLGDLDVLSVLPTS